MLNGELTYLLDTVNVVGSYISTGITVQSATITACAFQAQSINSTFEIYADNIGNGVMGAAEGGALAALFVSISNDMFERERQQVVQQLWSQGYACAETFDFRL